MTIIIFILIRFIPGNPVYVMLGEKATPEAIEYYTSQLGLDKPFHTQYILWLKNMLAGNWGRSILYRVPVKYYILNRFSFTMRLALLSMVLLVFFGIGLGIISVYKIDTNIDKIIRIFSILGWSSPIFLTSLILLLVFSLYLGIFPSMGKGSINHLILPSFALSLSGITYISRMTRGSILEIMGQDYIRTAFAKGLSQNRILFKHILKNAFIPIITTLGMSFGWLLSGSYIVEIIFSLPGLGELTTTAVLNRDYPVIQGSLFFTSIIYCIANLVVDIIYTYIDPRSSFI